MTKPAVSAASKLAYEDLVWRSTCKRNWPCSGCFRWLKDSGVGCSASRTVILVLGSDAIVILRDWREYASLQGIVSAIVETTNVVVLVSTAADLEIGADGKIGRKVLDRKADRFGSARKAPVVDLLAPRLSADLGAGKLRFGAAV